MSKLSLRDRFPQSWDYRALHEIIRQLEDQINNLSEGRASAFHAASTTAPTTGAWVVGDTIKNSAPSVLGGAGSQYVISGWVCTAAGTPGTWVEQRTLTGT